MTLFEVKENMQILKEQIAADRDAIMKKAANPATPLSEIEETEAHLESIQKRFNLLQIEHDRMEAEQRDRIGKSLPGATGKEDDIILRKAAFYKAALTGGDIKKAYEGLGAIPEATADLGYGENLLPTNLSRELILEPLQTNSLREVEQVSQITGLEESKLSFTIEETDLADVTDKQTANEIEATGGTVSYGRYKTKVVSTIKDTVLHGSPFDLVNAVENALKSGIAIKEKLRAFSTDSTDTTHKHMSFYLNEIAEVEGANLIDAIIAAIADLPDNYHENAKVVMRRQDYFAAIRTLANSNDTLWGKKPEEVIGYPVIFNDRANHPVVGDFNYARQNYDIGTLFETDKDAVKGEYYFVVTAWGDHQIKLKSAFRIAKVAETPEP